MQLYIFSTVSVAAGAGDGSVSIASDYKLDG
jgi:hypothetical protein